MEQAFAQIKAYYSMPFVEYDMNPHAHPRMEIMYIQSGACKITIEKQEYSFKSGEFLLVAPNVYHALHIDRGCPCHVINLEFTMDEAEGIPVTEFLTKFCPRAFFEARPFFICHDNFRLGYALKDLLFQLESGPKNDYLLKVLFHRMLIELARCLQEPSTPASLAYIRKAADYIRSNFEYDLSVAQIANQVGINESYLQTLFKKQMGCSIVTYINNLRIQKARFLLKNSEMDVTEIAFAVGYNSRQHFGYVFKKVCGLSPLSYRQKSNLNVKILRRVLPGEELTR